MEMQSVGKVKGRESKGKDTQNEGITQRWKINGNERTMIRKEGKTKGKKRKGKGKQRKGNANVRRSKENDTQGEGNTTVWKNI